MTNGKYVPLESYREYPVEEMRQRAGSFRAEMQRRRSVRDFSDRPVPREIVEECLRIAASAPSGANMQPWHFVAVGDPATKERIRAAAEKEEYEFYHGRAGAEWLGALSALGTDHQKPFLETAPYLIVVFSQSYGVAPDGRQVKHYYVRESVGIATGLLLAAVHHAGLAALPYTPSRPGFLNEILGRPENERPFVVLVVGYPAAGALVPDIQRKAFEEIVTFA
ncbi:MAG: nitroreductase family protein [Planctomycetes bacterium]|nr:nitroreductase family protein [Planctomycetota bacterium]